MSVLFPIHSIYPTNILANFPISRNSMQSHNCFPISRNSMQSHNCFPISRNSMQSHNCFVSDNVQRQLSLCGPAENGLSGFKKNRQISFGNLSQFSKIQGYQQNRDCKDDCTEFTLSFSLCF